MARAPTPDPGPAAVGSRQAELARWRKRSEAIHFWRRALPVVIVAIAAVLVLWVGGRSVIIKLAAGGGPKDAGIRMVNPRFYGRDTSNRAFVLGAAAASRDMTTGKTVTLSGPSVTLDADGANPTHVQATQGVYREDQRKLDLTGQVQLKDGRGYSFSTPQAQVDTTTGAVSGHSGVTGDGPLGRVVASSYGVYDRGQRIVMKGDVHAHIVQ